MDSKDITYHIGGIAKELGVSARTIRYYEELGLLHPSRTDGGFRLYGRHDLDTIKLIIRFRDLGLALEEIRALVAPRGDAPSREALEELSGALLQRRRDFLAKITELGKGIEQIDEVIGQLTRCRSCGEPMERGICERCMKERGEHISPLLDSLI